MNEKDTTIKIGMVIQNNDPEMRGRVKVYIPQTAPNITKLNTNVDKFFNFIGQNISPDITTVLDELKDLLPWAEYAGPIFGGNASGRYNATLNTGTESDSNAWKNNIVVEGFRPANNYVAHLAQPDAFNKTGIHKNKFVNQYTYQYTPSNYTNLAKGMFSIPNVGAHVYVFFINGDINFPVYFASAYGQEDIKRLYTMSQDININSSIDYPATYENIKKPTIDSDVKTFRSKSFINSNKHSIELIDTDLKEIMKFTHYSGSFKEFNNIATIELAVKNDQKLVLGDQFLTVQKNKSEYIKNHNELIVGGDRYLTIGETKKSIVEEIVKIHKEIHNYKRLFDTQRAKYGETPNEVSTLQTRSGQFKKCPVCKGNPYTSSPWIEAPKHLASCLKDGNSFAPPTQTTPPNQGQIGYYKGIKCPSCNGTVRSIGGVGYSPSSEDGTFTLEPKKISGGEMDVKISSLIPKITEYEKQLGLGGDEIINVSMSKIETIGTVMNDLESYRIDPIGKLKIDGCWVAPEGTFESFKPSPHVEYVDIVDIPGGDYVLTAMNKYKLLVGSKGINIQTTGPIDIYGSIVNITGEQLNISSKNEIVVDGGERLSLRARKITLLPVEHNPVVIEGQLHVTRNTIIEGGLMLEGEAALLHVTAPLEWQETEAGMYESSPNCETITCKYDINKSQIQLPSHTHYFKNLPLTLLPHSQAVRSTMIKKGINSRSTIASASVAKTPGT